MTNLEQFLRIGGQILGLEERAPELAALVTLATHWRDIARGLNDLSERPNIKSIDELFVYLDQTAHNDAVAQVIAALNLPDLAEQVAKARAFYDELPEPAKRLAAPLSQFTETPVAAVDADRARLGYRPDWVDGKDPGEVALPISLFTVKEDASTSGGITANIELGAEATLSAEAGALWPYKGDAVPGGLLQLSVEGQFTAKGGAKIPFSHGSVTASADAELRAAAMYFFRPKSPDRIFAAALVDAVRTLPNPYSLDAVWAAMATNDLEGVVIAGRGHAQVSVALAMGATVDIPKLLTAGPSITVDLGVKRAASYVLSVRRLDKDAKTLRVALSRDQQSARNWGVGVGLTLDLSPLFARVHALLNEVVGKWDKVLGHVNDFLSPGAWVQKQASAELTKLIGKWVKDDAIRAALTQDLGVLLGSSEAEQSSLQGLALSAITDRINHVAGLASGAVEAKAQAIIGEIIDWLPSLAQDGTRTALQAELEKAIAEYQAKLDDKLAALAGEFDDKTIINALSSVGVKLNKAIKGVDDRLAGLRAFVAKYDALLHDIVAFTGDAAKQKIALQLSVTETRTSGMEMEVVADIDAATEQARHLYQAMLSGQFAPLIALFKLGGRGDGFTLDTQKSSLKRFAEVERSTGFTFVGFGLELKVSELLSAKAAVDVSLNGDVVVVASSELTRDVTGVKESRSVSFLSSYDLALVRADGAQGRRAMAFTINATHRDKNLKLGEVEGFIGGLSNAHLIDDYRSKRAVEVYQGWFPTKGSNANRPHGDILIRFQLDRPSVMALIAQGNALLDRDEARRYAAAMRVTTIARDAFLTMQPDKGAGFHAAVPWVRKQGWAKKRAELTDTQWILDRVYRVWTDEADYFLPDTGENNRDIAHEAQIDAAKDFTETLKAAHAMLVMMANLARIYNATPKTDYAPDGWTEKDYRKAEEAMANASRHWLSLEQKFIFWFDETIGRRTVAFYLAIIALSQDRAVAKITPTTADPHFAIALTRRNADGEAGEVVAV